MAASNPDVEALIQSAQQAHASGATVEADAAYRRAIGLAPRHAVALAGLASLRRGVGDLDEAARLFEAAARAAQQAPALQLELAATLMMAGRFEEALRSCRKAVQQRPDIPEAHLLLSEIQNQSGDAARAKESAARALRLRPGWGEAHVALGNAEASAGDHAAAEEEYRVAIAAGSDHPGVVANLGHALRLQGRFDEALAAYQDALGRAPGTPEFELYVGAVLYELARYDEAKAALEALLARVPDFAQAHYTLGNVLGNLERAADAEACYRKALELSPGHPDATFNLAEALYTQGRAGEAIELLRKVLDADPKASDARQMLIRFLQEERRFDEMDALCREGSELEPKVPFYAHKLGVAHWWRGRHEEAIVQYRGAAKLAGDPSSEAYQDAMLTLGSCLLNLGRYREGWEAYAGRPGRFQMRASYPGLIDDPRKVAELKEPKRILIVSEQGIGDELFFLRFAPYLRERGHRLFLETDPKLVPVLGAMTDLFEGVVARDLSNAVEADLTLLSGDLPLASGRDTAAPLPLAVDAARRAAYAAQLREFGPPPYIGVTWRGGVLPDEPKPLRTLYWMKDVPVEQLGAALRPLDARVVIVQRRPSRDDLAAFRAALGREALDLSAMNADLRDSLALLAQLDDYVGVSNTNMHLRAGLGASVRVLVLTPPEWRWGIAGETSPWFPDFKLYRQAPGRGWTSALQAITDHLS